LVYEDAEGAICFTFDLSPAEDQAKGKWKLHLDRQPLTQEGKKLECTTAAERKRVTVGLERTKEYAASRGYLVDFS
jgi:hypothetical protein